MRELEESREVIRIKTLAEQKRNEQEFTLAQETQESLLPRALPRFENYRTHAFNHPTRYVGGDIYDFLQVSSGEWMGVLADVSGKGMPAALLSSMVLGALRMEFRSGTEPQEVLQRVNRLLCEKSLPSQFVSLFLFMLGPGGAGRFISAGHDPVYLFRAATGELEKLTSDAAVLGLFVFGSWETRPFHLDGGDILVVYSDGLIDAENADEEMFGEKRLREVIRRQGPSGGCAVEQGLLQACKEFTGGLPQIDDITLVVVEKRSVGNPEPSGAQRHLVT